MDGAVTRQALGPAAPGVPGAAIGLRRAHEARTAIAEWMALSKSKLVVAVEYTRTVTKERLLQGEESVSRRRKHRRRT